LSYDHLFIRDVEGERRFDTSDLPLRVGTGTDCQLRLPGPGGGPVMLLDLLDGAPFVQPFGQNEAMQINGEPLTTSTRLSDGDVLKFYGSQLSVSANDERLTLSVRLEDSAYVTAPPELPKSATEAEEETIAPTAFRRAAQTQAAAQVQHRSPLKAIVGSAFGILAIIAWLLFTSSSVQFEVNPQDPDSVSISGGWFRMPMGDRVLLRNGEYTVVVRKDGYYDVNQTFAIEGEDSKTVEVRMRKLPGLLTVVTSPPVDAVISIDNGTIGKAPFGPVELQPGEHSVSVRAERFLPFGDVVSVPGLGQYEELHVQLVPRWSNITVSSEPAGATIYAGERKIGVTPASIELLEGTHQLSVVREGFRAWDGTVEAEPNIDQELPLIQLEPANAKLLVNSIPRSANVTVDGRYRGQSPITLSLSPGVDYEIGLSKAGYGATSRQVRLGAAASDSITVDLSARTGSLTVNVQPTDATVYVDGRARGTGSKTLQLSSAPHRVEVRKDGYQTWTRTVTPRPGYPQTVTARLRTLREIEQEKVQQTVNTVDEQVLRRVEPGTFTMGSSRAEQGRRANEVLVPVTLTRPFLIGVREVTNDEFAKFRPGHDSGSDVHPSIAGGNNPVANVTWADAVEYCNWLSTREGLKPAYEEKFGEWTIIRPLTNGYRLPTEAEWAWAIKFGGSQGAQKFSWGSEMPPKRNAGNFADRSAIDVAPSVIPRYDDGFASSAPVGKFPANALGIYDGAGNVAEWVNDIYSVPTPGLTTPIRDPLGPETGNSHVARGSSWRHGGILELRTSFREAETSARPDLGFRIARTVF
jgi:formylglycine-generating enzyme required for sulfatase activity